MEKGLHEGRPYGGRWKGPARGAPLRGKVERECPRGTPLRGKVERAPTRGAPTGEGGKGAHEGRPYGEGWKGGAHEGRPYGGRWKGGAHEGRPYGGWGRFVSGRADVGREREGWVPACARTTEGEGMTGEGWVTSPSPRGQALRGNNGRGRGFHCGMTGYTGTGGSRTARTGEGAGAWGQSIFIAITGEGAHEGRPYGGRWKGRAHEGRPYGGRWKGRAHEGRPYGGRWKRACTRDAPTGGGGKGVHEGRPYGERWKGRARGTPLRGKVERACTRDAPTGKGGKGLHEGRPCGGRCGEG